jgi:hypothetical protein
LFLCLQNLRVGFRSGESPPGGSANTKASRVPFSDVLSRLPTTTICAHRVDSAGGGGDGASPRLILPALVARCAASSLLQAIYLRLPFRCPSHRSVHSWGKSVTYPATHFHHSYIVFITSWLLFLHREVNDSRFAEEMRN